MSTSNSKNSEIGSKYQTQVVNIAQTWFKCILVSEPSTYKTAIAALATNKFDYSETPKTLPHVICDLSIDRVRDFWRHILNTRSIKSENRWGFHLLRIIKNITNFYFSNLSFYSPNSKRDEQKEREKLNNEIRDLNKRLQIQRLYTAEVEAMTQTLEEKNKALVKLLDVRIVFKELQDF